MFTINLQIRHYVVIIVFFGYQTNEDEAPSLTTYINTGIYKLNSLFSKMTVGPFFIDYEAFQHGNDVIMKELCIMDYNRPLTPLYYVFMPPYDYKDIDKDMKQSFKWETKHHHHLHLREGNTMFCKSCIMRHISDTFLSWDLGVFYVMENQAGGPKVQLLKAIFPLLTIVNYNVSFNFLPKLSNVKCIYRRHGEHCAYLKCMRMIQHYKSCSVNIELSHV